VSQYDRQTRFGELQVRAAHTAGANSPAKPPALPERIEAVLQLRE
jgi:hypothetical protein